MLSDEVEIVMFEVGECAEMVAYKYGHNFAFRKSAFAITAASAIFHGADL